MRPGSSLSMLIIATLLKGSCSDPCSKTSYSSKKGQYKRSSNYTIQSNDIAISDSFLSEGWYRFDSGAGNDIVTWAPSIYQCGTIYPMWMNGTLPTESDGEVNRTVCIVGFYESCLKSLTIKVKNCGVYRVYYLEPAPQTSTGYCIGGKSPCPAGQSSYSMFTPCEDVTPVNTNPFVNVSLENKQSNSTRFRPAEPVFKCVFDEPTDGPYWYDTYWYINTDTVKVEESQPYQSNQSWLYPKDWVDKYDLNMVVKCSIRVRHLERSTPGHHNYSENFKAGMFPSSYVYGLKEGETISIKFSVTVPVGCLDMNRQYLCKTNIYILTPEYQSSSPTGSCQNFSRQGDVSFDENGCGIVIESSTWWEEKVLNVTGKTDGLVNIRDREVHIKLGSLRDGAEDLSGVWYNFSMPDIKVSLFDKDKKTAGKVCSASTDPRMVTFDNKGWTAKLAGEFIMYRDKRRQIAVHAIFSTCRWSSGASPPCGCGVAVRVENSLFAYRTCKQISYILAEPLKHHETLYRNCDNRHMVVEIGGPNGWTKITLYTGAVVKYRIGEDWIYEIQIFPSIFDEDNVEGLCGNPNGNIEDDFIPKGQSSSIDDQTEFQKSWRVDIFSTQSLFGINTLLESNSFKFKKYCDCLTETQQNENSIANHYTANCSLTTQAIMCNGAFASQSSLSRCNSNQNRFKREGIAMDYIHQVEKRSVESDDILEVPPLTLDPSFDPDFIPPILSWTNGWTESAARDYCENIILNDPARIGCQKFISMENSTNTAVDECVLDIRDTGTTDFSRYTIENLNEFCFEQIKKYEIFHVKSESDEESVVDTIGKLVCPNNCTANGICKEGVCNCNISYIGLDCSHAKSTPPANLTLPENGLCKTSKRACAKTNIFGHFRAETVHAKIRDFEITENGRTAVLSTYYVQATYVNPTIVRVNFPPNSLKKRTTSGKLYGRGFYITLSYDELNFSDSLVMLIYNDVCYSCNASTLECNNTFTCQHVIRTPKKTDSEEDNTSLPWIISVCVVCVFIIGTITVLIFIKRKHRGHFSPWCVDIKEQRHLPKHPTVQRYDTINLELEKSTSQNYEILKPPVVDLSNDAFDG